MNPLEGLPEYINSLLGENEMMGNAERWVSVAQNAADPTFPQLPGTMEEMLENMPSRSSGEATPIKHELLYNAAQSIKDNFLGNIIGGGVASYADKLARGQKQGYTDFLMASLDTPGPGTILKGGKLGLEPLLGLGAMVKGFHGSGVPDIKKFKDEFIGTGEGAQARGYGHYFAENENIAGGYQERLERTFLTIDGKRDNPFSSDIPGGLDFDAIHAGVKGNDDSIAGLTRNKETIDWFNANKSRLGMEGRGRTYNVELDVEKGDLLDLDEYLDKQKNILDKIPKEDRDYMEEFLEISGLTPDLEDYTGSELQQLLGKVYDEGGMGMELGDDLIPKGEAISKYLNSKGIPGNKFLDSGSRKPGNNVIYKGKRINIVTETDPEAIAAAYKQGYPNPEAMLRYDNRKEAIPFLDKVDMSKIEDATKRNVVIFDEDLIKIVE